MSETKIDLSKYHNALNWRHQLVRLLWNMVWGLLARPLPRSMGEWMEAFSVAVVWGKSPFYCRGVFLGQSVLPCQLGDGCI